MTLSPVIDSGFVVGLAGFAGAVRLPIDAAPSAAGVEAPRWVLVTVGLSAESPSAHALHTKRLEIDHQRQLLLSN